MSDIETIVVGDPKSTNKEKVEPKTIFVDGESKKERYIVHDFKHHPEKNKFSLAKWVLLGLLILLLFILCCLAYVNTHAPNFSERWDSIFSQLVTPIFSLASLVVGYYFGNNTNQT
ncbi:hypothetical protein H0A36_26140 [Endozoicomonas sp. SM1973]|uniref:Uncharacterized protein n=1 Tax=Spartinivicinus marinus TaxID=2994442 RepID=A0A853ICC4_9GAMM|nr:hypothetical protein [Spartinivicinus marinus]NYZ69502.1 hypothetical protein [Spartinivicinus marinus]